MAGCELVPETDTSDPHAATPGNFDFVASQSYLEACAAAGIPIPSTVADPNDGWVKQAGPLSGGETFLGRNQTELWTWEQPGGYCSAAISIDLWRNTAVLCASRGGQVGFFRDTTDPDQPGKLLAVPSTTEAVCTDCHRGQDPLVASPAIAEAVTALLTRHPAARAFEPLQKAWGNPTIPAPAGCSDCHSSLGRLDKRYCNRVLLPALQRDFMPPPASRTADNMRSRTALIDECRKQTAAVTK